jgi:uncharacterized protein (TIGR02172 family)
LGRTAEIYPWNDRNVLKLFREGVMPAAVEDEARIARAVHAAGLPVPAVGEIVERNGRLGLVYERVEGVSMLETFRTAPWALVRCTRVFAELHAAIHTYIVPTLPSQRQRLARSIRQTDILSSDTKIAVLNALDDMLDDERVCHGDFHPGNVLMTAQGPVIIDWMDGTRGNPLADVARTSLLLRIGGLPLGTPARWLIEAMRRWFHLLYLRRYFQLCPDAQRQLSAWQPIIAAARLRENIREEQHRLLALIKIGLK